ncbi:response regulator [Lusitaniella coriacea LEGE 07157]|uniref:histidine kinase n=1 Tax=Lusitaniella coriacea LEGE 07157 TaxID=945747 RepID=A0A8J7IXG2_9CYAN|nr:response regulator [Lusitaniella coriacea]MBE9118723.1 response regulator [Lusitaniella coriacea LEGE 07157]
MTNAQSIANADILIVDDTPDNLRILSTILTKQGYEVRKALNGQMAMTVVQTRSPDLILLDIMMPQMDGYEVCQSLKNDPKTAGIPIIFLSALKETFDKVKAFEVGGADYITKPFQMEEVLVRVKNQLTICNLQKELRVQNEELQQSNQELEQFTSIVSHDLKQPIQSIIGFARLLDMIYQDVLDEKANQYLSKIVSSSNRMQSLIDDLLLSSRFNSQLPNLKRINCNTIVNQIISNLEVPIEENQATIDCESLPTILANETQMMQLFQNLIHNAIKYQRSGTQPQVKVSATQKDSGYLFTISDNGIGISNEQFSKIFERFHRIPTEKDYEGTGIGLAICKQIVERYGGEIWVESELDVGTQFYFTLPSEPQE